jgi:xanthine dehydrogenase accessory factor
MNSNEIIVVRGGGDLATGVAQKLWRAGFRVAILEAAQPTAIRRAVALSEAVYEGLAAVEDISARLVEAPKYFPACWAAGEIPLLVDPEADSIRAIRPAAVIDAILAKKNLGTRMDMAPVTIALGPGFRAGEDVNAVIETMRGHDLGRLILIGGAFPDTGTPGELGGKSAERVLRAPLAGTVRHHKKIGDIVSAGEAILSVDERPVRAGFAGLLRGLIREGTRVPCGMKIADIDPRTDIDCRTISDKARCLGGAALEAYLYLRNNLNRSHTVPQDNARAHGFNA